jgi:hypothetical protein
VARSQLPVPTPLGKGGVMVKVVCATRHDPKHGSFACVAVEEHGKVTSYEIFRVASKIANLTAVCMGFRKLEKIKKPAQLVLVGG